MELPKTISTLPEKCIVVPYDTEGCVQGFEPGSTMSVAGMACGWGLEKHPLYPFEDGKVETFFGSIQTTVPMDEQTSAFWNDNPEAKIINLGERGGAYVEHTEFGHGAVPLHAAFRAFLYWLEGLWLRSGRAGQEFPVVLLARPHKSDAPHVAYGFEQAIRHYTHAQQHDWLHYADLYELYANRHGIPLELAKEEVKRDYLPKHLFHEPLVDSMAQTSAFLAGMLSVRGAASKKG